MLGVLEVHRVDCGFAKVLRDSCQGYGRIYESATEEHVLEVSDVCTQIGNAANAQTLLSATGMMNNWWFRVAIHDIDNGKQLKFEHPTMAGTVPGGWMPRMVEDGLDALRPIFTAKDTEVKAQAKKEVAQIDMRKAGVDRKVTMAEVEAHNTEHEPWFVVNGEVYDGTSYLTTHPGGAESITLVAGEDASTEFMSIHSSDAKKQLVQFHIGTLIKENAANLTKEPVLEAETPDTICEYKSPYILDDTQVAVQS